MALRNRTIRSAAFTAALLLLSGSLSPRGGDAAPAPPPRPQTFAESVEVREIEMVVDLEGALSRLKKATLEPTDLTVIEDGLVRPVTRVGPIAEGRIRNPFGREEAIAAPDWTVVVWIDRVLAAPDTAFYAALALAKRAEALTRLGPVEVVVADPAPRLILAASREPRRVAEVLAEVAAQMGRQRDRPSEHPDLRPSAFSHLEPDALRRQCERLKVGLAAPRPGGPRLLLLAADGFLLSAAEQSPLEPTARLLAAYGWTAVPLRIHGESPGPAPREVDAAERIRIGDQGGGTFGNSVPPVTPTRAPRSTPLHWEGVAQMQVQPDAAPLRALVRETAGALVGFEAQLDLALASLGERWHFWFQAPDTRDGRLHEVEVRLVGGQPLRARRWLRSATPEAVAEARLRRLLGGEAPPGGSLPLDVRVPAGPPTGLRLAVAPFAAEPTPAAPVRVSIAWTGPDETIIVRHETLPGIEDPGEGWSAALPLPAPPGTRQVAVLVEDLARERWAVALARPVP
jgi:hypothetical protein